MRRAVRWSWLIIHGSMITITLVLFQSLYEGDQHTQMSSAVEASATLVAAWAVVSVAWWRASRKLVAAAAQTDTMIDTAGRRLANDIDAERGSWS